MAKRSKNKQTAALTSVFALSILGLIGYLGGGFLLAMLSFMIEGFSTGPLSLLVYVWMFLGPPLIIAGVIRQYKSNKIRDKSHSR